MWAALNLYLVHTPFDIIKYQEALARRENISSSTCWWAEALWRTWRYQDYILPSLGVAEHLLFDCYALALVRFTEFGLMSKDGGNFNEDMADGRILGIFCRLMDLPATQEHNLHWRCAKQALEAGRIHNLVGVIAMILVLDRPIQNRIQRTEILWL